MPSLALTVPHWPLLRLTGPGTRGLRFLAFQGPPGAAGISYTHTQASAAATWTINHNLGFRPAVELLDTGGAEIDAEIIHLSVNTAQALFTLSIAGTARCL